MPLRRRPALAALAAALVGASTLVAPAAEATVYPHYEELPTPQVGGTYVPVVGNFSDDEYYDDLLWYAPGSGTEYLWTDVGERQFVSKSLGNVVTGTYTPIVGDFTGDQLDDILWYRPGSASDVMWKSAGLATWTSVPVNINGTYTPIVLDDEDEAGKDDILWIVPGGGNGSVWSFTGTGSQHLTHGFTSVGGTKPLVGDFDDDDYQDVFWYGPGNIADALWYGNGQGVFTPKAVNVSGSYIPVVNELDDGIGGPDKVPGLPGHGSGSNTDDIFWYRASGGTAVWYGWEDRTWTQASGGSFTTNGIPLPSHTGSVYVWSPTAADQVWNWGGLYPTLNTEFGSGYTPIVGNWWGGEHEIVWYKPGASPEKLFT